ncbi:carboxyltransferase domain-containing protein, partial [Staphylococcus aureus]|uniref:carboxyltransferase domain-containing protein n=1 Tax=Staphylococcus aureus TaxID=1280 RepID=UPI000A6716C4
GLNKKLYINHTSKQKKFIPAGSVVLEGKKCGIVTTDTINDRLVIGYTPLSLFNPKETDFARLKLGDNIKFRPINENE